MKRRLALALMLLTSPAWAQQEVLWKAENTASPTLVPSYLGQPSPFPTNRKKPEADAEAAAAAAAAAEAAAKAQATAMAVGKARAVLQSPAAFEPNLDGLSIDATMKGPAGVSMLVRGRWLTQGTMLQVPARLSPQAMSALAQLQAIDPTQAFTLRQQTQARLAANGSISLTAVNITSGTVLLKGGNKQIYRLYLSQPEL